MKLSPTSLLILLAAVPLARGYDLGGSKVRGAASNYEESPGEARARELTLKKKAEEDDHDPEWNGGKGKGKGKGKGDKCEVADELRRKLGGGDGMRRKLGGKGKGGKGKGGKGKGGKGKGGKGKGKGSAELLDPLIQPLFAQEVPNALNPDFFFEPKNEKRNKYVVNICKNEHHQAGIYDEHDNELYTPIYGYGDHDGCTWPGKTFEVESFTDSTVRYENELHVGEHYILTSLDGKPVVDTSLHWAYNLPGYEHYSIKHDGVPTVVHFHGGHTDSDFDGGPEQFYSPGYEIKGPFFQSKNHEYDNSQEATTSWYHDHTLGITRLNVYAGMAGFYILRDDLDTGKVDNPLNLPAYPYEAAFAIQDRMFKDNGELFYPAFPGDPFYDDFIDADVDLPEDQFPGGGPTALAEFFGNMMVVNGKIWPKMEVEPRNYRFRLLNGCDSRFLLVQFFKVPLGETELPDVDIPEPEPEGKGKGKGKGYRRSLGKGKGKGAVDDTDDTASPIPFYVTADDHALAYETKKLTTLMIEPGARYDVVFNFADYKGYRIIMKNVGPDEPFKDEVELEGPERTDGFEYMDRVMAFDVTKDFDYHVEDKFDPDLIKFPKEFPDVARTRRLGLFEGRDNYGRLQPVLGTVDKATDAYHKPIYWPYTHPYKEAGLAGKQMQGTMGWHEPTTELIKLHDTEVWELWNLSADSHPIHIHLVFLEVVGRYDIKFDSNADEDGIVTDEDCAAGDGTYLVPQPLVQHDGEIGQGFRVGNPTVGHEVDTPEWYFEDGPKDTVVALPGQVTKIKATFDKPGRFVWHCHILSHEDHEMMRVFYIED